MSNCYCAWVHIQPIDGARTESGPDAYKIVWQCGLQTWFRAGHLLHRSDGPAVITERGELVWYRNGARHRTDGPAFETLHDGASWFLEDEYVCEDHPDLRIIREEPDEHIRTAMLTCLRELDQLDAVFLEGGLVDMLSSVRIAMRGF